jgi:hypothetical protein
MMFSTKGSDHDTSDNDCAVKRSGAWWYTSCGQSNLNGIYQPDVSNRESVSWKTFKGRLYSLKTTQMMMRRI